MHIESSVFSAHRSDLADFTVVRGDALLARYPDLPDAEWHPLVHARALPGGIVRRAVYDSIKKELVERLAASLPLDGLVLDIHGAMSVEGIVDAEADLVSALREVLGPRPLISAAMDPHGNLSRGLASVLDLATSHRTSPHEDAALTRERAVRNLVACLDRDIRPQRAWVRVPVLLPGEKACTRDEPAHRLYAGLADIARRGGIIDAAIWIGYAWADEPRCGGAVLVTGTDESAILTAAGHLAHAYWAARAEFAFSTEAGDADRCIAAGLRSRARPFFISDSGDNPTAGGAGDVAFMLDRLLQQPALASGRATAIWASLVDPGAVAACVAAGEGATLELTLGGALGSRIGTGVRLQGVVLRIRHDDPIGGDIAVLSSGGVRAILTSRRKPYHFISDFTELGLEPAAHDLTIVKIGYLVPDLFAAAGGWLLALTPGGVDQDIVRLGHRRLARPIYPLDSGMSDPPLEPELIASAA